MTGQSILEVRDLSRSFGKFQALKDVSLNIEKGRLCALIGPNGAGKTTFYNVVSGRYRPTSGRVLFEGQNISRTPTHRRPGRRRVTCAGCWCCKAARSPALPRRSILRSPACSIASASHCCTRPQPAVAGRSGTT